MMPPETGSKDTTAKPLGSTEHIQRVLVICIEDVSGIIQVLPILQRLREELNLKQLDCIVGEWVLDLLEAHPSLDSIQSYNAPWIVGGRFNHFVLPEHKFLSMAWEIRRNQYDAIICFQPDFRLNALCFLGGAPVRIGFGDDGGGFFLSHCLRFESDQPRHKVFHQILELLGIAPGSAYPLIEPLEEDLISTREVLKGLNPDLPMCVIFPEGNAPELQWPPENYTSLLDMLKRHGYQILLLGGPEPSDVLSVITREEDNKQLQIWDYPTLGEIAALTKFTKLYIGIDSYASHLMSASGVPSVILICDYMENRLSPIGQHVRLITPKMPCKLMEAAKTTVPPDPKCDCLQSITIHTVIKAITDTMNDDTFTE